MMPETQKESVPCGPALVGDDTISIKNARDLSVDMTTTDSDKYCTFVLQAPQTEGGGVGGGFDLYSPDN